jgi:hypothetical protein
MVLAVACVLSFGVNARRFRAWRALLVLAFLGLAMFHARALPFFAVVAGPVLALNLQEAAARLNALPGGERRTAPLAILGRGFGFLLLLAGLATAWPGWLSIRPHERHRVGWDEDFDPALKGVALFLDGLREQGDLPPDARGFHYSPETGNALAWYAPEVKGFFDHRYELFGDVIPEWVQTRASFADRAEKLAWPDLLDRLGADYVVLYAGNVERLERPFLGLTTYPRGEDPKTWVLLYLNGRAAVFGSVKRHPSSAARSLKPRRLAYAPAKDELAPPEGMEALPVERPFWYAYTDPLPPRSEGADECQMHVFGFRASTEVVQREENRLLRVSLAAGVTGAAAPLAPGLASAALAPYVVQDRFESGRRWLQFAGVKPNERSAPSREEAFVLESLGRGFFHNRDEGDPAHLYLAIRAARRALGGPNGYNDFPAHAHLTTAYQLLVGLTRERSWRDQLGWVERSKQVATFGLPPLRQLRYVQITSELVNALTFEPENEAIHANLAAMYSSIGVAQQDGLHRGCKDLELEHRKHALRLARAAGPRRGEPYVQFEKRIQENEKSVQKLAEDVDRQQNRFNSAARNLPGVLARAVLALDYNLAGQALAILMASNQAVFGVDGTRLQIELALMAGRVRDVKSWFDDIGEKDLRERLEPFRYHWFATLLAASLGDYEGADRHLRELPVLARRTPEALMAAREMGIGVTPREFELPTVEVVAALAAAKVIADGPLPASEAWTRLNEHRLNAQIANGMSIDWVNLQPDQSDRGATIVLRNVLVLTLDESTVQVLRGILAVEQGNVARAREAFGEAIRVTGPFLAGTPAGRLPQPEIAEEFLNRLKKP